MLSYFKYSRGAVYDNIYIATTICLLYVFVSRCDHVVDLFDSERIVLKF